MDADKLEELERLLKAASPQPWYYPDDGGHLIYGQRGLSGIAGVFPGSRTDPKPARNNAALIVAAINALPELVARVRELEGALAKMADCQALLCPFAYATRDDSWGEMEKLLSIVMNNYVQTLVKAEAARTALKGTPT